MDGSGRKTLWQVRMWSEDPPGRPEVVGDPPGGPEVVGRLFGRSGCGRMTLREVRKRSGDRPGGPKVVGRPAGRSGSGRETLWDVRKWS